MIDFDHCALFVLVSVVTLVNYESGKMRWADFNTIHVLFHQVYVLYSTDDTMA